MNKKKILSRLSSKAFIVGMTIMGFSSGCSKNTRDEPVVLYGMPVQTFMFDGKALDSESKLPVKNLSAKLLLANNIVDYVRTDSSGSFLLDYLKNGYPGITFKILIEDTDGSANGSYESKDTSITELNPKQNGNEYHFNLIIKKK